MIYLKLPPPPPPQEIKLGVNYTHYQSVIWSYAIILILCGYINVGYWCIYNVVPMT